MSATMFHVLDTLHMWLAAVATVSVFVVLGSLAWWDDYGEPPEPPLITPKLLLTAGAALFLVAGSLAIALPTSRSIENAMDAEKAMAKRAYCIANPGKCK